jgi:hypothetical protein
MNLPAPHHPVHVTCEDRLAEPNLTSVISAMARVLNINGRRRLVLGNIVLYLGRAWTWQLVYQAAAAPPGERYVRLLTLVRAQLPPDVRILLERAAPPEASGGDRDLRLVSESQ